MGFLPRKVMNLLWGTPEPVDEITRPIECDACADARSVGRDACDEHHHHHGHGRHSSTKMRAAPPR